MNEVHNSRPYSAGVVSGSQHCRSEPANSAPCLYTCRQHQCRSSHRRQCPALDNVGWWYDRSWRRSGCGRCGRCGGEPLLLVGQPSQPCRRRYCRTFCGHGYVLAGKMVGELRQQRRQRQQRQQKSKQRMSYLGYRRFEAVGWWVCHENAQLCYASSCEWARRRLECLPDGVSPRAWSCVGDRCMRHTPHWSESLHSVRSSSSRRRTREQGDHRWILAIYCRNRSSCRMS